MNNKIDDVLFSLIQARENITQNSKVNINDDSYNNLVNGLDNLITDYTINNKMSGKEIIDCAVSLYGKNNSSFLDKLKNLRPKKIIENIKNKIEDYNKKKELKSKYEDEIVIMIKERIKNMVEDDRKTKEQPTEENTIDDISYQVTTKNVNNAITNSNDKELTHDNIKNENSVSKISVFNKDIAKIIDPRKSGTFIFKNKDNFCVYRESDNMTVEKGKLNIAEFSSLNQAIVYAIDDKLSLKEIKDNFNKYKNNYGNLANYIIDKRELGNNYNTVNINKDSKEKTI